MAEAARKIQGDQNQWEKNLRQEKSQARLENKGSLEEVLGSTLGGRPDQAGVQGVSEAIRSAVAGSGLGLDRFGFQDQDTEQKPGGRVIPLAPRLRRPRSAEAVTSGEGGKVLPLRRRPSREAGAAGPQGAPTQASEVSGGGGAPGSSPVPSQQAMGGASQGKGPVSGSAVPGVSEGGSGSASSETGEGAQGGEGGEEGGKEEDEDKKKKEEEEKKKKEEEEKKKKEEEKKEGEKKGEGEEGEKKEGEKSPAEKREGGEKGVEPPKPETPPKHPSEPGAIMRGLRAARNKARENRYVQAADRTASKVGSAARGAMDRVQGLAALPGQKLSQARERAGKAWDESRAGRGAKRVREGAKAARERIAKAPGIRQALSAKKAVSKRYDQMKKLTDKVASKAQYVLHPIQALKIKFFSWAFDYVVATLLLGVDVSPSRTARAILGNMFHMDKSETFKKIIVPLGTFEFIIWLSEVIIVGMVIFVAVVIILVVIMIMVAPSLLGAELLDFVWKAIKGIFK